MANIFDTLDAPADTKNLFDSIPASDNSFDGLPHDVPSFEELKEAGALPREGLTPHMLNQERQAESNRQVLAAGGDVLPSDKELMEKHLNDALMTGDEMEALGLPRWLAPVERGVATSASGMSDPANIAYAAMPGAAPAFIGSMAYDSAKNIGKGAYHVVTGQGEQGAQELTEGALGAMIPAMVARSGMKESARDASSAINGEPAAPLPDVDATARQNLSIKDAPAQVVQTAPKSQNIFDALDEKPIEAPAPAPVEQAKPIGTLNDIIGSKLDEIKSLLQKQQPEGEPNATANAKVEQQTSDVPVSAERNQSQGTGAIREVPTTEEANTTENEPANAEAEPLNEDISGVRNAIVEEKRESLGLPEPEEHEPRSFDSLNSEAATKSTADGIALIDKLKENPRPLTDSDVALLSREQLRREQAVNDAVKNVNDASDEPSRLEYKLKLAKALDDVNDIYDVGKTVGTLTAQGLNARRILLNQDFSLSRMLDTKRAVANEGRPLSDAQVKEVSDLHAKIESTQKAFDDYVSQSSSVKIKKSRPVRDFISSQAVAARERIRARAGNLNSGLDPTNLVDHAIVMADYISKGASSFADASERMLKEFGDSITPHLRAIFDAAQEGIKEAAAQSDLAAYKNRLIKSTSKYESKTASGIFYPPEPKAIRLDAEAFRLREINERAKQSYRDALYKDRMSKRPTLERIQDATVKWSRAVKLASPTVIPKLVEAGLIRIISEPISRILGQPLRLIPGLSEKANAEIGINLKSEVKNIVAALTAGPEALKKLTTGRSNLDVLGKKLDRGSEMMNFIGNAHGAIKEPVRQGAFARSVQLRLEQAAKGGLDITDPIIQASIVDSAVADANRQIFMGENPITKYLHTLPLNALKHADFVGAKSLAHTLEFLMPIVKVSSNIAIHSMRLNPAIGLGESFFRLLHAAKSGELENNSAGLSHEDAAIISRAFKAGMLGTVLAAYAWNNPDNFGGVYNEQEPKKKKGDLKFGAINVLGKTIPPWMNHAPEINFLNTVASSRRIYDRYAGKSNDKSNAETEALAFSLLAPVKNFPFIDTYLRIFNEHQTMGQAAGSMLRDAALPTTAILRLADDKERSPKTFSDEIKMGVPGLRGSVQEKKKK